MKIEYNYELQVWVINGIVRDCGHPRSMHCEAWDNQKKYAGKQIAEAIISDGG